MTPETPWLNKEALAAYLGLPYRYVRERLTKRPDFPAGRRVTRTLVLWDRREIDAWVESCKPEHAEVA